MFDIKNTSADSPKSSKNLQMHQKESDTHSDAVASSLQFTNVKAKIEYLENIAKSCSKNLTSTINPGNHKFTRQKSCPVSTSSASNLQLKKRHSFEMDSHDNNVNIFDNDKFSHLNESSSLEVEVPTSNDEHSSPEFDSSEPHDSLDASKCRDLKSSVDDDIGVCNISSNDKDSKQPINPLKPLIRARTFEIIDPNIGCKSGHESDWDSPEGAKLFSCSNEAETISCKRNDTNYVANLNKDDSVPTNVVLQELKQQDLEENPQRIREMERKKGSLIFEHNFQTFSNIPTTNMMTASMMTASISSESSMGLGSLYSSIVDNAMLSSIHSLGGPESSILDIPMKRPASVCLPVYPNSFEETCNMEAHKNIVTINSGLDQQQTVISVVQNTESASININQNIGHMHQNNSINSRKQTDSVETNIDNPSQLDVISTIHRPPLTLQKNSEAIEFQRAIATRKQDTRSPSPDSLSVDIPDEKPIETSSKASLFNSSSNKEELDNEEKEKDEKENDSKSSNSSDGKNPGNENFKNCCDETQKEMSEFSSLESNDSSQNHHKRDENMPIVSGGLMLEMKKVGFNRQSSSTIKDVDSIPLVFGYVMPNEDEKENVKGNNTNCNSNDGDDDDDDGKQPQSMFSMFIDLKELPSPEKEENAPKSIDSNQTKPQSGVYMFIEADITSPKHRRRIKSEYQKTGPNSPRSLLNKEGGSTSITGNALNKNSSSSSLNIEKQINQKTLKQSKETSVHSKQSIQSVNSSNKITHSRIPCYTDTKFSLACQSPKHSYKDHLSSQQLLQDSQSKSQLQDSQSEFNKSEPLKSSKSVVSVTTRPSVDDKVKENFGSTSSLSSCDMTNLDSIDTKDKKGLFMFIEANTNSKSRSPKTRRRPFTSKKKGDDDNVMTKSAPSDSLLFSSQENSCKLMTKSVIDREEFMAQPVTRRNVSLNDKINESSSRDHYVSNIPRPIHSFRFKSTAKSGLRRSCKKEFNSSYNSSTSQKDDDTETNDNATSKDVSELGTSLSVSFSEMISTGFPPEMEDVSDVSDVSSLLSSIDRSNGEL